MVPASRGLIALLGLLLLLGLFIACEEEATAEPTAAPTPAPAVAPTAPAATTAPTQAATAAPVATAAVTPSATPTPTPTPPPAMTGPTGTLNVGMPELGPGVFDLPNQGYEQFKFDAITTHEAMFATSPDGAVLARIVQDWSADPTGLVYTFHLPDNAQWHTGHGDWGLLDADDFIFSLERVSIDGTTHSAGGHIRRIFTCDACALEKIDSHTVQLTRPRPTPEITWRSRSPTGSASAFHSKKHFDSVGEEGALQQSVGTGPWELMEVKSGDSRTMRALEDHWRRTPDFEEMVWFDISEDSTRLANFLSGTIDTGSFGPDQIQAIKQENMAGVKFMTFPGAADYYLNLEGQQYLPDHPWHQVEPGAETARIPLGENASYLDHCGPDAPWVSCDRDVTSQEWANAQKVRLAMNQSIDRQKLVNNLAFGDGDPEYVTYWIGHDGRFKEFGLDQLVYEYDPDKARQLLEEAGYPDGFDIDMALTLRPQAGAVEAGQAVATMWEEVGIRANQFNEPMSSFRPKFVRRTALGVNTHSGTPPIEPMTNYASFFSAKNALNFGFEHPMVQELIDKGTLEINDDARWALSAETARFIFDNAMQLPLYTVSATFPLSPKIDAWAIMAGANDWLSNWEDVPHRQ